MEKQSVYETCRCGVVFMVQGTQQMIEDEHKRFLEAHKECRNLEHRTSAVKTDQSAMTKALKEFVDRNAQSL